MRRSTLVLGALVGLAAPVAGVTAYQSWAPGPARAVDPAVATSLSTGSASEPLVRYRPCRRPGRLEGGVCVTHRVRVIAAPPVVAAAPISGSAPDDAAPPPPPDQASPAHPVHHPPTHEPEPEPADDPTDQPFATATAEPTAEPSATCEPSDGDDDGDHDGDDLATDRAEEAPLGWTAGSTEVSQQAAEGSTSDCEGHEADEADDGDGDDGDHGDDGGVGAD